MAIIAIISNHPFAMSEGKSGLLGNCSNLPHCAIYWGICSTTSTHPWFYSPLTSMSWMAPNSIRCSNAIDKVMAYAQDKTMQSFSGIVIFIFVSFMRFKIFRISLTCALRPPKSRKCEKYSTDVEPDQTTFSTAMTSLLGLLQFNHRIRV